jgi:hypothetical protein
LLNEKRDRPTPEIIPPGRTPQRRSASGADNESLDHLATVLDELFTVPGTRIRFGLDALLGLIPGLGDALSGVVSSFIIFTAHQRGLPRITIMRMVANVLIDSVVGAVPFAGDLFDVAWKSNRKNVELLKRSTALHPAGRRKQTLLDAAFLVLAIVVVIAAVALPVLALVWLVNSLRS